MLKNPKANPALYTSDALKNNQYVIIRHRANVLFGGLAEQGASARAKDMMDAAVAAGHCIASKHYNVTVTVRSDPNFDASESGKANQIGGLPYILTKGREDEEEVAGLFKHIIFSKSKPRVIVRLGRAGTTAEVEKDIDSVNPKKGVNRQLDFIDYTANKGLYTADDKLTNYAITSPVPDASPRVAPSHTTIKVTRNDSNRKALIQVYDIPIADFSEFACVSPETYRKQGFQGKNVPVGMLYDIYKATGSGPVVFHCRSGVGRGSILPLAFMILDYYDDIFNAEVEEPLEKIFTLLAYLRSHRVGGVQTFEQFVCAIDTALKLREYEDNLPGLFRDMRKSALVSKLTKQPSLEQITQDLQKDQPIFYWTMVGERDSSLEDLRLNAVVAKYGAKNDRSLSAAASTTAGGVDEKSGAGIPKQSGSRSSSRRPSSSDISADPRTLADAKSSRLPTVTGITVGPAAAPERPPQRKFAFQPSTGHFKKEQEVLCVKAATTQMRHKLLEICNWPCMLPFCQQMNKLCDDLDFESHDDEKKDADLFKAAMAAKALVDAMANIQMKPDAKTNAIQAFESAMLATTFGQRNWGRVIAGIILLAIIAFVGMFVCGVIGGAIANVPGAVIGMVTFLEFVIHSVAGMVIGGVIAGGIAAGFAKFKQDSHISTLFHTPAGQVHTVAEAAEEAVKKSQSGADVKVEVDGGGMLAAATTPTLVTAS